MSMILLIITENLLFSKRLFIRVLKKKITKLRVNIHKYRNLIYDSIIYVWLTMLNCFITKIEKEKNRIQISNSIHYFILNVIDRGEKSISIWCPSKGTITKCEKLDCHYPLLQWATGFFEWLIGPENNSFWAWKSHSSFNTTLVLK